MSRTRRSFLSTASASVALAMVSLPCGTQRVTAQTRPNPRAAWAFADARTNNDPRLQALAFAILAPNPHNRQPWVIELSGEVNITIRCDLERRLPKTDPFDRQITIGFGGFLELLRMAAAERGYEAITTMFPEGEPGNRLDQRAIATVTFRKNAAIQPDPLFRHVLIRRTNRGPYDMARPVEGAVLADLLAAGQAPNSAFASSESKLVAELRDLVWAAFKTEALTHDPHMESVNLMRFGRAEVTANPDGISLDAPEIEPLVAQGILTRAAMASPDSAVFKQFLQVTEAPVRATPAFIWQVTPDNRRVTQLETGRDWVRLNLKAAGLGLGLQPQSAALQEYPEMDGLLREVHHLLGVTKGRIQMLGRVGFAPQAFPSPRWPLDTRLRT